MQARQDECIVWRHRRWDFFWGTQGVTPRLSQLGHSIRNQGFCDREQRASYQCGGKLRNELSYRIYAEGSVVLGGMLPTRTDTEGGRRKGLGRIYLDLTPQDDIVMLDKALYRSSGQAVAVPDTLTFSADLEATRQHRFSNTPMLRFQPHNDAKQRSGDNSNGSTRDTNDLELRHNFSLGDEHVIVWGTDYHLCRGRFATPGGAHFNLADSRETLADMCTQEVSARTGSSILTHVLKPNNDARCRHPGPRNVRSWWKASGKALLWLAAVRMVRMPLSGDAALVDIIVPTILILADSPDFQPKKAAAYEIGSSNQATLAVSFSALRSDKVHEGSWSVQWAAEDGLSRWPSFLKLVDGRLTWHHLRRRSALARRAVMPGCIRLRRATCDGGPDRFEATRSFSLRRQPCARPSPRKQEGRRQWATQFIAGSTRNWNAILTPTTGHYAHSPVRLRSNP